MLPDRAVSYNHLDFYENICSTNSIVPVLLFDTKNSLASIKISESEALIKRMYSVYMTLIGFYCYYNYHL